MHAEIKLIIESGGTSIFPFEQIPDKCPICHNGIKPDIHLGYISDENQPNINFDVQVIFQCPLNNCQSMFIGYYKFVRLTNGILRFDLQEKTAPFEPVDIRFNDTIVNISPSFVEIYNQALKANQIGWQQIAGPGFRKSLEFLIKDYCSSKAKSDEEKENIKKINLSQVIENYIADERIKKIASRAVWIGNDETHYVRTWEAKDLMDLKNLIQITLYWIEFVESTNQYIEEMPKEKK